jgi:hypothetical protein
MLISLIPAFSLYVGLHCLFACLLVYSSVAWTIVSPTGFSKDCKFPSPLSPHVNCVIWQYEGVDTSMILGLENFYVLIFFCCGEKRGCSIWLAVWNRIFRMCCLGGDVIKCGFKNWQAILCIVPSYLFKRWRTNW